jgi:DNA-binding NarL/FixJ family response regulator
VNEADYERPVPAPLRIALVEDHKLVALGFADLIAANAKLRLVTCVGTVREIPEEAWPLDLVVLDLRLEDGSSPADNVRAVHAHGAEVLVLTGGENAALARSAAAAGVLGIVRKSEALPTIMEAIVQAAQGQTIPTTEWAAALDADENLTDAGLSDRERQILALYASGEKAQSVAYQTGLSRATVTQYVSRIRAKYSRVGRDAPTKIELNARAREDGLLGE